MREQKVRQLWLLGMAVLFAVAHTQSPYVWSNQNQYYLHGAAAAGYGDLRRDWLANTRDPTPVFSWLVELAYRGPGQVALSVVYFGMLMLYFVTVHRLIVALWGEQRWHWLAMTVFLWCHSAIVRVASVWLFSGDYPWYMQAGVAGQYLLGPGLQPSVFGVLLLVGLANFAEGRSYRAAVWTASSAVIAPTYLLSAAIFVCGYIIELNLCRRHRAALLCGAIALASVIPVLAYLNDFLPSETEIFNARRLLAEFRLPHHCQVNRWLDIIAVAQIVTMVAGWWLLRGRPLFAAIGIMILGSVFFSVLAGATGGGILELMFPWRVSVVLMPLALVMIVHRLCGIVVGGGSLASTHPTIVAVILCIVAAGAGIWIWFAGVGYYVNHEEDGVIEFVAKNRHAGDEYLLPIRIPDLIAGPRGSKSLTFVTPKPGNEGIPPDFQRFRLATGAAIYVDFKSIPYADVEVLEWYRRLQRCALWYSKENWEALADEIGHEGVTHVIVPATITIQSERFQQQYEDGHYRLYRILTIK